MVMRCREAPLVQGGLRLQARRTLRQPGTRRRPPRPLLGLLEAAILLAVIAGVVASPCTVLRVRASAFFAAVEAPADSALAA